MFQYQDNILCIEARYLCGESEILPKNTYIKLLGMGVLRIVRRAYRGNSALIDFHGMPKHFQDFIIEKHAASYKAITSNQ